MKICIVSSEYPPFRGGGIGTYAATTGRALAQLGHQVHVIANSWTHQQLPRVSSSSILRSGGQLSVHRLAALDKSYRPLPPYNRQERGIGGLAKHWESCLFWSYLAAEHLEALDREVSFDIVEFPECFAEGYVAMRLKRLGLAFSHLPMTVTLHSPMIDIAEHNLVGQYQRWCSRRIAMENFSIRTADSISSPSRLLAQMMEDRTGRSVTTIANGLDMAEWPNLSTTAPHSGAPQPILFIGRLEPRKGVRTLVEAALRLMPGYPNLEVHLIGRDCPLEEYPGSMKRLLEALIPTPYRHRFVFVGELDRQALWSRLAAAAACVFPAPWDNFPYTCCEAMAAGGCVIGSRNSGMAEMIEDGVSGLLVDPGDPRLLATTIARIVDDPDLANTLRRNAPNRIRALTHPATVAKQRLDFYRETIEKHMPQHSPPVLDRSPSIAVLIVSSPPKGVLPDTLATVETSAAHARAQLRTTIGGDRHFRLANNQRLSVLPTEIDGDGDDRGIVRDWIETLSNEPPDFLLVLRPGDRLGEEFLWTTLQTLERHPEAAWATTWAFAAGDQSRVPYAGFDFEAPLEMIYHHPVPFALIRFESFSAVGGWNFDLPSGWREWDLWLAFEENGFRGSVVPVWQAHYVPAVSRSLPPIHHGKTYEKTLEAIIARSPRLFRDHGATMWLAEKIDGHHRSPIDPSSLPSAVRQAGERYPLVRRLLEAAQRFVMLQPRSVILAVAGILFFGAGTLVTVLVAVVVYLLNS